MFLSLLSTLYKSITSTRNILFDKKIFKELELETPSIGVGNLTVGGTGKTPMVNYLISILNDHSIAVISRGYGRKTKGFRPITLNSTPEEVGDEPYMLAKNNPNVNFFVSEKRVEGYQKAKQLIPEIDVFIFDDVYQHRHVKPLINILLCDYNRPFYNDYLLPKGRLRETRQGAKRADIVVVTKVPEKLSESEKIKIENSIREYIKPECKLFFAEYTPQQPVNNDGNSLELFQDVVLISALANNNVFKEQQAKNFKIKEHFQFKDHHSFSRKDIDTIFVKSKNLPIITTEKDMVKIKEVLSSDEINKFYIPVIKVMLNNEFTNTIRERISLN